MKGFDFAGLLFETNGLESGEFEKIFSLKIEKRDTAVRKFHLPYDGAPKSALIVLIFSSSNLESDRYQFILQNSPSSFSPLRCTSKQPNHIECCNDDGGLNGWGTV